MNEWIVALQGGSGQGGCGVSDGSGSTTGGCMGKSQHGHRHGADGLSLCDGVHVTSRLVKLKDFAEHYRRMAADSDFRSLDRPFPPNHFGFRIVRSNLETKSVGLLFFSKFFKLGSVSAEFDEDYIYQ